MPQSGSLTSYDPPMNKDFFGITTALLATVSCLFLFEQSTSASDSGSWQVIVRNRLPAYGHRNWIVIADSAYPDQSSNGIETIVSNAEQVSVLKEVLTDLAHSEHVRPIIYEDRELAFLSEQDAPGVSAYREQLRMVFAGRPTNVLLHEKLISKLDADSKLFKILLIKTNLTIPYTTIFLQLDCAYWSADAEKRLRSKMASSGR